MWLLGEYANTQMTIETSAGVDVHINKTNLNWSSMNTILGLEH